MQYATIILNSKENTFEKIVDEVIQDLLDRGQMSRDNKDSLKNIILSQHRNNMTISSAMTGKKVNNLSGLFSSNHNKNMRFSFVVDPNTIVNNTGGDVIGQTMAAHVNTNVRSSLHASSKNMQRLSVDDAHLEKTAVRTC